MDNSKSRHHHHGGGGENNLGVNKLGKNIRKSPLHHTNLGNNNAVLAVKPNLPQPQVYNISKNDFRNVVQQLTGSPSHNPPPPRPPQNSAKSLRLQRIRPPPLMPINQNPMRPPMPPPMPQPQVPPPMVPYNNNAFPRPAQFGQQQPSPNPPSHHPGETTWTNTAESPISAYMRSLQYSMMDPGSAGNQVQPQFQPLHPQPQGQWNVPSQFQPHLPQPQGQGNVQHYQPQQPHIPQSQGQGNVQNQFQQQYLPQPQVQGNVQNQPPSSALLPNPPVPPMMPSPRFNGPLAPTNATNAPVPSIPSPQTNGPPILPSPTSQFLLPSPTGYSGLLSPRSPYPPLLSPGIQFPSPLTPNFLFSPLAQSGVSGPGPQPPASPGLFPMSPTGFFQMASPRWRDP